MASAVKLEGGKVSLILSAEETAVIKAVTGKISGNSGENKVRGTTDRIYYALEEIDVDMNEDISNLFTGELKGSNDDMPELS